MEVIMDWVSSHIIEILTFLLVCITGVYAFLTWRYVRLTRDILEENQQMRLDAQKPEIAIYLRSDSTGPTYMYLYVENIGVGPAYDVKFTTDLCFRLPGNHSLGQRVPFLGRGIRYLPPEKIRMELLGSGLDIGMRELMQRQLEIAAAYKDSMRKKYEESFCLDFREHGGS
ncbi:hypothetical protein F4X33_13865 [Candidatus Poribacteria bacterium]|nr:hypothetical protein [Candidatus Poribacteria bacterium]